MYMLHQGKYREVAKEDDDDADNVGGEHPAEPDLAVARCVVEFLPVNNSPDGDE